MCCTQSPAPTPSTHTRDLNTHPRKLQAVRAIIDRRGGQLDEAREALEALATERRWDRGVLVDLFTDLVGVSL